MAIPCPTEREPTGSCGTTGPSFAVPPYRYSGTTPANAANCAYVDSGTPSRDEHSRHDAMVTTLSIRQSAPGTLGADPSEPEPGASSLK